MLTEYLLRQYSDENSQTIGFALYSAFRRFLEDFTSNTGQFVQDHIVPADVLAYFIDQYNYHI